MSLRLIFMGTPEFAAPTLRALIASQHQIAAVYCQPPRPAGRGLAKRLSPIQELAEAAGLEVRTPVTLRGADALAGFAALKADVAVVVAYGLLLPPPILSAPKYGCLNLHPSKLPRWRGAAPIQRTLMAGDAETAICVMGMEAGLDTGPVRLSLPVAIPPTMTAGELHDLAAVQGAGLILMALTRLEAGTLPSTPQDDEGVTYAVKITKAEARIDWHRSARQVHDHIRGLSPFPGAWFEAGAERIKVLEACPVEGHGAPGEVLNGGLAVACAEGAMQLKILQRAGRKPMPASDMLRGMALPAGTLLT